MIYIRSWSLLDSTSAHISCDADKALDQSDLMFLFLFSLVLPFLHLSCCLLSLFSYSCSKLVLSVQFAFSPFWSRH